jgi:iron complex outermembrane receptor protein
MRRIPRRAAAVSVATLLPALWCNAQAQSAEAGPALTLGAVRIQDSAASAGPLPARGVLTSVDVLGGGVLQDQQADHSWELLARAPGVMVTPFRQGTDAGRFSFRGFNGEGRINAVKLLIDGIPSNDNAGGMPFLDAVFPMDIDRIEIVRGTNDPRYGLHSIAGNASVFTRIGGNRTDASVTAGSFGTREVQLAKGLEAGNWSQNYFLAWRDSDGWRDHADARQASLAGKWFYTTDDARYRGGLILRHYENRADESGYLDAATARRDPRSSPAYAASDRSTRETSQASLHLDGEPSDAWSWSAKAYAAQYRNRRWVRFSAAGAQQERFNDEAQVGALATLTWRPKVDWAHEFALEGGLDVQRQDNLNQRWRTIDRVRQSQFRDWDFTLDTQGAYLQAVVRPVAALRIVPALRIDHVGGHFTDRLTGAQAGTHDYGVIRQPKLSVSYAPWSAASLYGNWGRTFQVGAGIDAYQTQPRRLRASINDGWETGVKFTPAAWIEGRVAYWEQRASGEVQRVLGVDGLPDPGGLGNVGRTLRKGYDLQVNLKPNGRASAWAAYSHQTARIVEPDPSAPATRGNAIENVPRKVFSAGVDWQAAADWKLSAWGNGQGDYFIERTNALGRFGGYVLLNAGATWRIAPTLSLQLQVKNLADRRTEYVWYDSGSSGWSPGDGRGYYATLRWTM